MQKQLLAKFNNLLHFAITLIVIGAFVVSPLAPLALAAEGEIVDDPLVVLEAPEAPTEPTVIETPIEVEVALPAEEATPVSDSEPAVTINENLDVPDVEEVIIEEADETDKNLEEVVATTTVEIVVAVDTPVVLEVSESKVDSPIVISGEFGGNTDNGNDTTPPSAPIITASSHGENATSTSATTTISWSPATDDVAVAGYSFLWDNSPNTDPDDLVELDETITIWTEELDQNSWYFHIKAIDTAGNVSATTHYGPVSIELPPVEISNIRITDVTQNSAVIRWTTNRPATSRVIYDTISHPDISTETEPNFGYASSTIEQGLDPNKVTEHAVLVSGLTTNTTYYFRVLSKGSPLAISGEFGGSSSGGGNNNQSTGQGVFTTLPTGNTGNSSGQGNFTTLPTGNTGNTGSQGSFTTLAVNTGGSSGQGSFSTLPTDNPPTGCVTNCGGGGGGGGGSHRRPPTTPELPPSCPVYLLQYIKLGAANDPLEVRKLEVFLNYFEGYNLPVNGIYEQADYDAVQAFQVKYGQDVLNPWGLADNDPTGYVFITTTYAINQIFCSRSTANDFDLRGYYSQIGGGIEIPESLTPATITATSIATTTPALRNQNFLLAAAVGARDFIWVNWCWIFPLILLIIILILATELWQERRKNRSLEESLEATAALSDNDETLL